MSTPSSAAASSSTAASSSAASASPPATASPTPRSRAGGAAAALDGLRPAQTPRHSFAASLAWQGPRGAYASASARYVSGQYEDDLNRQPIPGALTLDAVAAIPLGRGLAIEARGENLTDEEVIAGISGAGILERATPRTLWLGLRWRGWKDKAARRRSSGGGSLCLVPGVRPGREA